MMERSAPIAISMTTAKSATAIIISTRVNPASPVVRTFCLFRSEKMVLILLHGYLAVGIDDNADALLARRGKFYACALLYLIVYLIETLDDVRIRIRASERNVYTLDRYFSARIDVGHIQIRDAVAREKTE